MCPASRRSPRACHGQASCEYAALLALVAIVAACAAGGVASPPLGEHVTAAVRHALCRVAGGVCTSGEARRAGLEACVVSLRSTREEVGAIVAVVHLRRGDTAIVERRSDGSSTVSFRDDNAVGATATVGLSLGGARGTAGGGGGLAFNTGRSHDFGSWEAARRFLARHASRETTTGEAADLARRLSPAHGPRGRPAARSTWFETGTWAELEADLDGALPILESRLRGHAEAAGERVIGRRRSGARRTWYLRLDGTAQARLGIVLGAVGGGGGEAVLEVTTEHGRLISAGVTVAAAMRGELSLHGHSADLGALADRLRGAAAGGAAGAGGDGRTLQVAVSLDLRVPENREAVRRALEVLRLRTPPGEAGPRLRELGSRLDSAGRVDISVYRTDTSSREESLGLALGMRAELERVRIHEARRLVAAWSAHGGPLREREDCTSARPA